MTCVVKEVINIDLENDLLIFIVIGYIQYPAMHESSTT